MKRVPDAGGAVEIARSGAATSASTLADRYSVIVDGSLPELDTPGTTPFAVRESPGAPPALFARVLELLKEKGADDIAVFGGGIIPRDDIAALKALGVKELFTPGTSTQEIVRFVRENIRAAV